MEWIKKYIWIISVISFIGGVFLGFYLEVLNFNSKLTTLEEGVHNNFELIKSTMTRPVPSETYFRDLIKEVVDGD